MKKKCDFVEYRMVPDQHDRWISRSIEKIVFQCEYSCYTVRTVKRFDETDTGLVVQVCGPVLEIQRGTICDITSSHNMVDVLSSDPLEPERTFHYTMKDMLCTHVFVRTLANEYGMPVWEYHFLKP